MVIGLLTYCIPSSQCPKSILLHSSKMAKSSLDSFIVLTLPSYCPKPIRTVMATIPLTSPCHFKQASSPVSVLTTSKYSWCLSATAAEPLCQPVVIPTLPGVKGQPLLPPSFSLWQPASPLLLKLQQALLSAKCMLGAHLVCRLRGGDVNLGVLRGAFPWFRDKQTNKQNNKTTKDKLYYIPHYIEAKARGGSGV